jgi:AraC-like DNA-binding protein
MQLELLDSKKWGTRAELATAPWRNAHVGGLGSVTDVAFRWGFTHPGRFADAYRERFGQASSETLRRARG